MNYTIFELERIEKILIAKRHEAHVAHHDAVVAFRENYTEEVKAAGSPLPADTHEHLKNCNKALREDMNCELLRSEVDLFERGINSLYSYWNSAVEIFIDKMRTHTSEKE